MCESFDTLLHAVAAEQPDVVITDIRMPPTNLDEGIRAAEQLRATHPGLGVVVLSQYVEPGYAHALFAGRHRASRVPAQGAGERDGTARQRDPGRGGRRVRVIDPKVVDALVGAKTRSDYSPLHELTPRELDVLREMAEGKNNAAIAASLFLTERSIEKVIHSIFRKLGLGWERFRPQAGEGRDPLPR